METAEFNTLLSTCKEFSDLHPGLVYIGGIAVYLHAINSKSARQLAEFTHDADFYISMADMSDLRTTEELTANRRLNKHQLVKSGFEFDIYTERQSSLIVPFDQVSAHAIDYDGIRVACPEHLLALKLEAYRDRRASSKGDKDARDIARLAVIAHNGAPFDANRCAPFLSEEHVDLLETVQRSPAMAALAKGNAVEAKRIRLCLQPLLDDIKQNFDPNSRPRPRGRGR